MRIDGDIEKDAELMIDDDFSGISTHVKISPFRSTRSNREVANQWTIKTNKGLFFQSYQSIIAFIPSNGGKTILDERYWDFSSTTAKYRREFLGEGKEETQKKIDAGEYILGNLNEVE